MSSEQDNLYLNSCLTVSSVAKIDKQIETTCVGWLDEDIDRTKMNYRRSLKLQVYLR